MEYILNIVSPSQILQPHNPFNSWTFCLSLSLENRQENKQPPKTNYNKNLQNKQRKGKPQGIDKYSTTQIDRQRDRHTHHKNHN